MGRVGRTFILDFYDCQSGQQPDSGLTEKFLRSLVTPRQSSSLTDHSDTDKSTSKIICWAKGRSPSSEGEAQSDKERAEQQDDHEEQDRKRTHPRTSRNVWGREDGLESAADFQEPRLDETFLSPVLGRGRRPDQDTTNSFAGEAWRQQRRDAHDQCEYGLSVANSLHPYALAFRRLLCNRPPHENRRQTHLLGDTDVHGFAWEHARETMHRNAGSSSSDSSPRSQHDMVHFKTSTNPHPLNIAKVSNESQFMDRHVPHPIWTQSELQGLKTVSAATTCPCKILPCLLHFTALLVFRDDHPSPPLWGFCGGSHLLLRPKCNAGSHACPSPPSRRDLLWITRLLALVPVYIDSVVSIMNMPDTTDAP